MNKNGSNYKMIWIIVRKILKRLKMNKECIQKSQIKMKLHSEFFVINDTRNAISFDI